MFALSIVSAIDLAWPSSKVAPVKRASVSTCASNPETLLTEGARRTGRAETSGAMDAGVSNLGAIAMPEAKATASRTAPFAAAAASVGSPTSEFMLSMEEAKLSTEMAACEAMNGVRSTDARTPSREAV